VVGNFRLDSDVLVELFLSLRNPFTVGIGGVTCAVSKSMLSR
jgi:hypothetical protein